MSPIYEHEKVMSGEKYSLTVTHAQTSLSPARRPMTMLRSSQDIGKLSVRKSSAQEEIGDAVDFLVSNRANYITGQVIHINGDGICNIYIKD